ncbi:MAG: hypothetical protein AAF291_02910 [Pseudomonadota bacterium]
MNPSQPCSDQANASPPSGQETPIAAQSLHKDAPTLAPALTIVGGELALGRPDERVPQKWEEAIEQITQGLGIQAGWVTATPAPNLIQRARRAVGADREAQAPIFAPWRLVSPTVFQPGQTYESEARAKWVASYLFDFGPACTAKNGPVDLALMSPCPEVCHSDDSQTGPMPRLSTLASMVRAAAAEGRTNLAIIVHEATRATIAARLLAFDPSLNEASLDVEFIAMEEAVVAIQRGAFEWDAVITMPELRGVLFAMLAQSTRVTGPWPMLWFDRGVSLVTSEALPGTTRSNGLDTTALLQALALLAKHTGRHYAARHLYESWAAVRDAGVVTTARHSSAPYVNEIDEAAFIDQATRNPPARTRPLPSWKGLAPEESGTRKAGTSVSLRLVT